MDHLLTAADEAAEGSTCVKLTLDLSKTSKNAVLKKQEHTAITRENTWSPRRRCAEL